MKARPLARRLRRLVQGADRTALRAARRYVATDEESGRRQLSLLKREGCRPSSTVLEVGCGALHAGIPTIEYLEPGNWVGIDPNRWLIDAALTRPGNRELVESKQASFLSVDNFDAGSLDRSFDFVLSHSVLSHQPTGSCRSSSTTLGRSWLPADASSPQSGWHRATRSGAGDLQTAPDSHDAAWVYPGVSWFTLSTVQREAQSAGLEVSFKPEYTAFYMAGRNRERHDWLVFSRSSR